MYSTGYFATLLLAYLKRIPLPWFLIRNLCSFKFPTQSSEMGTKWHSPTSYTCTFICEKSFLLMTNYSIIELNLQALLEAAMPRTVHCNACRPGDFYEIVFHKEINFLFQSDAIRLPSGNLMVNSYGYLACCFAKCLRILEDESCPR